MVAATRAETPSDLDPIREADRLACGREDQGRLVDALRNGAHARASMVAEVKGLFVGHVPFGDLPIVTRQGTVVATSLAPTPDISSHQRHGIGSMLVREGLRACMVSARQIAVVLGAEQVPTPLHPVSWKVERRQRDEFGDANRPARDGTWGRYPGR